MGVIDIGTFLAVDNDSRTQFLEIDGPVLIIRRTSVDPVVDGQPFGVQPRPDDIYIHIYFMYMDIKRRSCCSFHFPFDSLNGRGSFCLFFRSRVYYWHAEGLVYLLSTRTVGRPFLLLLLPSSLWRNERRNPICTRPTPE